MRKWLLIIFCISAVAIFSLLVSCSTDSDSYYVRFTANGQTYELTKGYSDIGSGDAVALISVDTYLLVTGTTDNISSDDIGNPETEVQNAVWLVLIGTTTGTYEYDIQGTEIEDVYIAMDGVPYKIYELAVTVSVINEEGSTIEGTFTATIAPQEGGDDIIITDGEFKLYRADDDSILPSRMMHELRHE